MFPCVFGILYDNMSYYEGHLIAIIIFHIYTRHPYPFDNTDSETQHHTAPATQLTISLR